MYIYLVQAMELSEKTRASSTISHVKNSDLVIILHFGSLSDIILQISIHVTVQ